MRITRDYFLKNRCEKIPKIQLSMFYFQNLPRTVKDVLYFIFRMNPQLFLRPGDDSKKVKKEKKVRSMPRKTADSEDEADGAEWQQVLKLRR